MAEHAHVVSRTWTAITLVGNRRTSRVVLFASAVGYLALYSTVTGALTYTGRTGVALQVVESPASRFLEQTGFLTFEPIARFQALGFSYLFSPIDASIAVALALLVGTNLAITYLVVVQPTACGLAPSSGVVAAVPALLSGAACCGPLVFIVLGIQATGILLTGVHLLLPLSVVLLSASLLLVGRQLDPSSIR